MIHVPYRLNFKIKKRSEKKSQRKKDPETETSRRFRTSRWEEKDRMRRYAPVRKILRSHQNG